MPRSGVPSCAPGAVPNCGITLRRDSGRGPAAPLRGALTIPPIMGMPPKPPSPAAPACGTPSRPATGNAVAASRIAGDAVAQDCGTDSAPTVAARPRPADPPAPPIPDACEPARSASPAAGAASSAAAGATAGSPPYSGDRVIIGPMARKSAWTPIPRFCARVPDKAVKAWLPGVFKKLRIAADGLGNPPDASDCSELGTWESTFWAAPAGEAAAWVTAAAWVLVPAGLVVGGGGLNGVTVVAAAEAPA